MTSFIPSLADSVVQQNSAGSLRNYMQMIVQDSLSMVNLQKPSNTTAVLTKFVN